ncbi:uncharacterized protein LOC111088396 isoform X1 [Limulus polyphemus]|uniref:Uncharacterized protein LOC111088396 isoform X1 n=1 Tax=Limulus polyphemus TaxID=6850 RepID=A0ABM1TE05_LIMPO|nr:uncharacterized protein LOC111088396 isoform X1 [Limulus polyphemus]
MIVCSSYVVGTRSFPARHAIPNCSSGKRQRRTRKIYRLLSNGKMACIKFDSNFPLGPTFSVTLKGSPVVPDVSDILYIHSSCSYFNMSTQCLIQLCELKEVSECQR